VQEKMREQIREGNDLVEYDLIKLSSYVASIEKIQTTVTYIISQDNSRYNANARWIEYRLNNGKEEYFVNAGVTHVGNLLDEKLWSKVYATCLTSATLAIGDSFEYIKSQLGLSNNSQCKEIKLDTEFNYAEHSQLSIPYFKNSPDFNSREAFEQDLITYLTTILAYTENYGSLVLFFNRQQLLMVYKGLPKAIQAKILLQTDFASNQKLLTTHRELIDEGKPSIIFGLNSFAEGVDLPVQYCMHVIITKLPFETYKDPQNMVREHWVKEENGNYFIEISLPETGIKLIQAVGRLIRSEQDYGQVTICDNRIVLKSYGNFLLNALPKFNRQYDPEFITKALSKMNCTF
jgi:ATP-dependent DNA helicase DinG